jgi:hypothetical protein
MTSSQEMKKLLERFNRSKMEAEDSEIANGVMNAISQITKPLSKLKMLNQLMPALATTSSFGQLPALAMASTAFTDSRAHLKQMDTIAQQRAINVIERRPGYNNAFGDTAARTALGLNSLGLSLGTVGALTKAAGMAGYAPNILENVNPLLLMGAMQGGKGIGTLTAGAAGGLGGLGSLFGAGTGVGALGAINPALLGFAAMMAINMGGSKLNTAMLNAGSTNIKQFKANVNLNLRTGMELELQHSNMVTITSQIKLLQNLGQLSPAEALHAQILMLIESHTSVIPLMVEEILNAREYKDKSGGNAGQNAVSDFFGEDGLLTLNNQRGTILKPNFIQKMAKAFAKNSSNISSILDIFGQIGNTLSGKSSVAEFNKANKKETDLNANQAFSDKYGIAISMVNTLHTSAAEVLSRADTFEAKQIAILSGIYELNRYQGHELLSIRRDGMGVDRPGHSGELARLRVQEEMDGEIQDSFGRMIDEMLGYIPLWHTISGTAKMVMAGYNNLSDLVTGKITPFSDMLKDINNAITETFTNIEQDEGNLRNTIGATILAPADLMARYLSGDYVKQMSELVEYNRAQAHYLKYLATDASSRSKIPLKRLNARDATRLDEFSGTLMNEKELEERNNRIGEELARALTNTAPNGLMGILTTMFIRDENKQKQRAEKYATENFNHIKELWEQFGSTNGYQAARGYTQGTGDTGKAPHGTKTDRFGGKPVGVVHEDEGVMPEMASKPAWFKNMFNNFLPDSSPKAQLSSTDKADLLHTKEVESTKLENELKQTEMQSGMVGFLKKISEGIDGVNYKLLHPKLQQENDLVDTLKMLGFAVGGFALLAKMNDMLTDGIGILAAIGAALGLPIASRLLKMIPSGGNLVKDFKNNKFSFKSDDPKNKSRSKTDLFKNASMDNFKNGAKDSLKLGGKALMKSAPLALLFGGIDYFLQSDTDSSGNQKTVGDKLKNVGEDFLNNTGAILGSVILGGLGAITPIPGGTIIGTVAGGIAGDYIQEKITNYWKTYAQHKDGTQASAGEKIKEFLKNNAGAIAGAGIGLGLGFIFGGGPIGGAVGIVAGGLIGAGVHKVISKVIETVSEFDFSEASNKIGNWANENIPGVEQGAKIGRMIFGDNPFGSFIGGLIGGAIMGPGGLLVKFGQKMLDWFGDDSSIQTRPLIDKDTNAVMNLQTTIKTLQNDIAVAKNTITTIKESNHYKTEQDKENAINAHSRSLAFKEKQLNDSLSQLKKLNDTAYKQNGSKYFYGPQKNKFFTEDVKDGNGNLLTGDSWALNRLEKLGFSKLDATRMLQTVKSHNMHPSALLAITSQEASGNVDAVNSNNRNGTSDWGMYQYNDKARLNDWSRNPEIQKYLKSKNKNVALGDGIGLGKAMLGDPILQTKILAMDFKSSGGNINKFLQAYNPKDIKGTNQKFWNLTEANKHYDINGNEIAIQPSDLATKTTLSEAKVNTVTTANQNESDKLKNIKTSQNDIQKINNEVAKRDLTQQRIAEASEASAKATAENAKIIQMTVGQLDQLNNRIVELSQMLNENSKVAKTLWSYIDKIYKEPKYNDYQFAYLTK